MELFTEDHFLKFHVPTHSPEWFDFRTTGQRPLKEGDIVYPGGIGASESAKLIEDKETGVPINEYPPSPAEMFEHKIGREIPEEQSNEKIFWGQTDEPIIGHVWQFWDGEPGGYVENHKKWVENGKRDEDLIRKCYDAKYYLVNSKYPWLFCSLDKAIAPGSANFITGELLTKPAPLEIKTIGHFTGKQYETGVPEQYIIQLHHQMIVTESDYGEIALKKAGQELEVRYYERNEELCKIIIDVTRDWWFERVLPARRFWQEYLKAEKKGRYKDAVQFQEKIDALQPGPNSTEAYRRWASGKYQRERSYMRGSFGTYMKLRQYELAKAYMKIIEQMKNRRYNELLSLLVDNSVNEVVFDDGYIRMGKNKGIYTGLKTEFDPKEIKENIKKLDFNL